MADWFRKKRDENQQEDFVLYNSNAGMPEQINADYEDESENDITCELDKIQEKVKEQLELMSDVPETDMPEDTNATEETEDEFQESEELVVETHIPPMTVEEDFPEPVEEVIRETVELAKEEKASEPVITVEDASTEESVLEPVVTAEDVVSEPVQQTEVGAVPDYMMAVKKEPFFKRVLGFCKKHKALVLGLGIGGVAIVMFSVLVIVLAILLNPYRGYVQAEVQKGNVIPSIMTSGNMTENDRYSITSLVAGKVVESVPALGDVVEEGEVLYELDDEKVQIAIKRAKNEVDKAKAVNGNADTSYKIHSSVKGKIKDIKIKKGAAVKAGQVVATVEKEDEFVVSVTSSVSGTVESVSATKGKDIASGGLIATVSNDKAVAEKKGAPYDQKSRQYDLDEAEAILEDYTIKAPVSGVIIEKNINVGDNVSVTNDDNPMMVIMDLNTMKFTFTLDEYEIWDIEVGQKAIITAEALPSDTFAGEVTRIGSEGKKNEEGKTVYDVEVTIEEPGALKVGMKVNAKIILASATNVLTVPKQALMEADGKSALVLVKVPKDEADEEFDRDEELAFPWIEVPRGCKLVTVKYGINDGEEVEIISGLEQGDIVLFDPDRENKDLDATSTSTPSDVDALEDLELDEEDEDENEKSKSSDSSSKNKSTDAPLKKDTEDAITPKPSNGADKLTEDEARKKIEEKLKTKELNM